MSINIHISILSRGRYVYSGSCIQKPWANLGLPSCGNGKQPAPMAVLGRLLFNIDDGRGLAHLS